ncbi:MAG TPA: hypothetical protein VFJ24_05895 [Gaiellales bacterium]|nr:hypothetical protein [Gaiellales bacterium]
MPHPTRRPPYGAELRAVFCDTCGREVVWFDARRTGVWACTAMNWAELGIPPPRRRPGNGHEADGTPEPTEGAGPGGG